MYQFVFTTITTQTHRHTIPSRLDLYWEIMYFEFLIWKLWRLSQRVRRSGQGYTRRATLMTKSNDGKEPTTTTATFNNLIWLWHKRRKYQEKKTREKLWRCISKMAAVKEGGKIMGRRLRKAAQEFRDSLLSWRPREKDKLWTTYTTAAALSSRYWSTPTWLCWDAR